MGEEGEERMVRSETSSAWHSDRKSGWDLECYDSCLACSCSCSCHPGVGMDFFVQMRCRRACVAYSRGKSEKQVPTINKLMQVRVFGLVFPACVVCTSLFSGYISVFWWDADLKLDMACARVWSTYKVGLFDMHSNSSNFEWIWGLFDKHNSIAVTLLPTLLNA